VHPGKLDKRNHHVFHVSSPSIVAEEGFLPDEIERFITGSPRARFIVIDSLRTLALYNKSGTISTFMRHVLRTAGRINSKVVVLTIKHEEDKVTEDTMPLFDIILNVED
jgi:archaellum biogenesis ATPase FlaH